MHNPTSDLENKTHKLLWDFETVDFAVLGDQRVKLKESERKDKYFDLAEELKKLWNMKMMIIPIVIGALGAVTKGLILGLEDLK